MRAFSVGIGPRSVALAAEQPVRNLTGDILRRARAMTAVGALMLAVAAWAPGARAETPATETVAEVNGVAITADDLQHALGAKLVKLEEQIYALKRDEIDALVAQRLLEQEAARRGMSVPALLDEEVTSKVALVTEQEVDESYKINKARLRGDEASARAQIRNSLQQQRLAARRGIYLASLRSKATIVVRLEPPPVTRVDVGIAGAPVRGAPDAKVTVVEFSDFECPFCKRASVTLAKIMEKYAGKIRLAYRDFPLESIHPQARRAAEAAQCARDGGKFWEYHDVLFAQSPKLAPEDLRRYASDVGLDVAKFDACLASGAHAASVQKDMEEGNQLGIRGTPAFFINGRFLSGAQPAEAFSRIIDDELTRTASAKAQ